MNRRFFLQRTSSLAFFSPLGGRAVAATPKSAAPRPLFDGRTLTGWKAVPRLPVTQGPRFAGVPAEELKEAVVNWYGTRPEMRERLEHTGRWVVVDGAIVGGHNPAESQQGAYR